MVIVGGMISDLAMSIFLLPTLYAWMARDNDVLPEIEVRWNSSRTSFGYEFTTELISPSETRCRLRRCGRLRERSPPPSNGNREGTTFCDWEPECRGVPSPSLPNQPQPRLQQPPRCRLSAVCFRLEILY
jgi:hypothetical protein